METRSLVARSGVNKLFISILSDNQVAFCIQKQSPKPVMLVYQEHISQKLMCAEKLVALSFDPSSCDVSTEIDIRITQNR